MKAFLEFVFVEGGLLIALFYAVSFVLVLLRERFVSSRIMSSLATFPLVSGSAIGAALGGITPFCSCSTVPVFTGMLRSNIRFGIAFSFLMASPLLNEIVVVVMAKFLGLRPTISFILLALLLPIACGILFDKLNFHRLLKEDSLPCGPVPGFVGDEDQTDPAPLAARLRFAALLSRLELTGVLPHLALGLLVGGLIYGFIPDRYVLSIQTSVQEPVLIVLLALIGIPLYVNMTTALPIAFALVEKGLGIGPIVALLVAGAGTSLPEMILLLKFFKLRLLLAFVATTVLCSILMGLFFSYGPFQF